LILESAVREEKEKVSSQRSTRKLSSYANLPCGIFFHR
jgi:hypothetical protein